LRLFRGALFILNGNVDARRKFASDALTAITIQATSCIGPT
jgi:hypothetical protein